MAYRVTLGMYKITLKSEGNLNILVDINRGTMHKGTKIIIVKDGKD